MRVVVIVCSVLALFCPLTASRKCYTCSCSYDWSTNTGSCSSTEFINSCTLTEVGDQYCLIVSSYDGNYERRVFEAIKSNNLQDSHFLQAIEQISLSGAVWLPTTISCISYGCDWDGCNGISLAQFLPESFQMTIGQTVLNNALVGDQSSALSCYSCDKCINELTVILCKQESCTNGICFIDELHNYITTAQNNCTYNFFSTCQPTATPPQTPNVRIRATYYIDLPAAKQFQIDEVDIRCTKDYCNSIEVVENLKGQIEKTITLNSGFQPSRPNDTTSTSTTTTSQTMTTASSSQSSLLTTTSDSKSTRTSTTTTSQTTTTASSSQSSLLTTTSDSKLTRSYPFSVLYVIVILLLLL